MNKFFRSGLGLILAMALIALLCTTLSAQTASGAQDPLVQVLVQKGVITPQDAKSISGTPAQQRDRLAQLLKDKGVISAAEYDSVKGSSTPFTAFQPVSVSPASSGAAVVPAVYTEGQPQKAAKAPAPAPAFIPAVAPTRVLQLEPSKPGGLIPDIKLGSKANMKIYGFFKASSAYDSSSPYGNDFPLPGFIANVPTVAGLADAGPGNSPEFHVKARAFRVGANFEWPDVSKHVAITGKIETDYEGDFTKVANRNISSIRSSQLSLRLAWGRIDYKPTDKTSYFFLAGQDWSPFGSSILGNVLESTIYLVGFGHLYEREPQMRVGMFHNFGGSRNFSFGPEFAIVMPSFGITPGAYPVSVTGCTNASTGGACTVGISDLPDQLGYGERIGADSAKPGIEGRLIFQFQADKAKGVAPAQIIVSGMHGNRSALVSRAELASTAVTPIPTTFTAFTRTQLQNAFNNSGISVDADRWGAQGGFSIPTRYVTLQASYYRGTDLRWYFAGGIVPDFNSTLGLQSGTTITVPSMDATASVVVGCLKGTGTGGVPCVLGTAPQVPVRAQGGFVELGFPLSRIFHAEPTGRNAGWTLNLHYGVDAPLARDIRAAANSGNQFGAAPGGRGISDVGLGNIQYKLNQFVTFGLEESYYRTRAIGGATGELPRFNAGPTTSHQWHDFRSEFFTIFTF